MKLLSLLFRKKNANSKMNPRPVGLGAFFPRNEPFVVDPIQLAQFLFLFFLINFFSGLFCVGRAHSSPNPIKFEGISWTTGRDGQHCP
jgi:hypothetical protein